MATTIGKYHVHPLAEIFPVMSDAEFRELCVSMNQFGFLASEPIVLLDNKILDGRNRMRAALATKTEPVFAHFAEPISPTNWVIAKNLNRRHLTETGRALVAVNLSRIAVEDAKSRKQAGQPIQKHETQIQSTLESTRRVLRVGEKTCENVVRVLNNGIPELKELMTRDSDALTADAAAQLSRLSPEEQQKYVKKGVVACKQKAADIRKDAKESKHRVKVEDKRVDKKLKFHPKVQEALNTFQTLTIQLGQIIRAPEGERFVEYVTKLNLPWLDYSKKKIVEKGKKLQQVPEGFVGLRAMRRLLAAAEHHRRYSQARLEELVNEETPNVLDDDAIPEDAATPEPVLVNPDGTAPEGYVIPQGLD